MLLDLFPDLPLVATGNSSSVSALGSCDSSISIVSAPRLGPVSAPLQRRLVLAPPLSPRGLSPTLAPTLAPPLAPPLTRAGLPHLQPRLLRRPWCARSPFERLHSLECRAPDGQGGPTSPLGMRWWMYTIPVHRWSTRPRRRTVVDAIRRSSWGA